MFKIITINWSNTEYIHKCVNSVLLQGRDDWEMCIISNIPIRQTQENDNIKIKYSETDDHIKIVNILKAIEILNPADEDILVFLDGDDFLLPNALNIIAENYYCIPSLLITYGNFITSDCKSSALKGYTEQDFKDGIRSTLTTNWQASHLKTMKYKLWKLIDQNESFKHDGEWILNTDDMAFMMPALEMAGYSRSKFIPDYMYCYNIDNPINNFKVNSVIQDQCCLEVSKKIPYKELT